MENSSSASASAATEPDRKRQRVVAQADALPGALPDPQQDRERESSPSLLEPEPPSDGCEHRTSPSRAVGSPTEFDAEFVSAPVLRGTVREGCSIAQIIKVFEDVDPVLGEKMRRYGVTKVAADTPWRRVLMLAGSMAATTDWNFPVIIARLQNAAGELRSLDQTRLRRAFSELKDILEEADFRGNDNCSQYDEFIDEVAENIIPLIVPVVGFRGQEVDTNSS
jgi:hypothetical protein